MSRAVPLIVLLSVSAVWGGAFAAIRYLVQWVSPSDLLVLRFVPTALLLIPIVLMFHRREFFALIRPLWWLFLGLCVIWLFGYHYALNVGETVLPAAHSGLIISTYPVFTVFLAALFLGERLTVPKVVGGLVALAGTVLLTLIGSKQDAVRLDIPQSKWIVYSLITLIAPISAAIHTVIARPFMAGRTKAPAVDPFLMTYGYMLPTGLLVLPLWRPGLISDIAQLPVGFWLALGFLVVFCTVIANLGYFWALHRIEAGPVAISTYTIPIFALAYAAIWLREPIGPAALVGTACIVAGVVISSAGGNGRKGVEVTSRGGKAP